MGGGIFLTHTVGESVEQLVACRTNNRKVVGSRPAKLVYHSVDRGKLG